MSGYSVEKNRAFCLGQRESAPTILVIDDEPDVRLVVRLALERQGFGVRVHGNGRNAVADLRARPVDLVVTDLFMPEFDGLEVIRAIRAWDEAVPIVAVSGGSGYLARDFLPVARQLGADAVLSKPFPLDDLLREVRRLLAASGVGSGGGSPGG